VAQVRGMTLHRCKQAADNLAQGNGLGGEAARLATAAAQALPLRCVLITYRRM